MLSVASGALIGAGAMQMIGLSPGRSYTSHTQHNWLCAK
jgi:hypothetical protein